MSACSGTSVNYVSVNNNVDIDSNVVVNINVSGLNSGCPIGSTRYQTEQGYGICVIDDFELPDLSEGKVVAQCERIAEGILGFTWNIQNQISDYDCPNHFQRFIEGESASCLLDDIELPSEKEIKEFCDYFQDGFIGYFWNQEDQEEELESPEPEDIYSPCHEELDFLEDDEGKYCLFTDLDLPDSKSLVSQCDQLSDGKISFSWSLKDDANYTCPQSFDYSSVSFIGTCTFSELKLPQSGKISPVCNQLDDSILGYSFSE